MWYYIVNQKVVGPVSLEEIINLINAGIIVKTTCLWQSGQVRQTAGQVPELVPFLQQEPLPRPEPTPKPVPQTASVPPKPVPRQVPRSQPTTVSQTVEETESTGSQVGFAFQIICLIFTIIFSLFSLACILIHQSYFQRMVIEYSQTNNWDVVKSYKSDIDGSGVASMTLSLISISTSIPAFIIGIFRKKYRIAVLCLVIGLMSLGYVISIAVTENTQFNVF